MNAFDAYKANPGSEALLGVLKDQSHPIYNLCFQVLREGSLAEDASQQVLLELVKQLPRISDGAHLKAWVSRAAFHAALDLKKKGRRREAHERRAADMKKAPALSPEQLEAVHSEIARLDDALRTIVVEHYFEQRPLKDLAAEQAVSEVAVWKRLQKAKERLRAGLAATGFAVILVSLDSLLEALEPVRAPEGLVDPRLLTSSAGATGASSPLVLAGGTAVSLKMVASIGLVALALAAGIGYAVTRKRVRDEEVALAPPPAARPVLVVAKQPDPAPPAAVPAAPPEEVVKFASMTAFFEAFMKAAYMPEDIPRARAMRRIGIPISDAEMVALMKDCRFRGGTEEYYKHLIGQLEVFWIRKDPDGILALARGFTDASDQQRRQMLINLFERWGKVDLGGAKARAEKLSEGEGKAEVLAALAEIPEPVEGIDRILALPPSEQRVVSLQAEVTRWAKKDPVAAMVSVEQHLSGDEKESAVRLVVTQWALVDIDAALDWAGKRTDPKNRQDLLIAVINSGAALSPAAAAKAASLLDRADPGLVNVLYPVIQSWSKGDPAGAAKFVDLLHFQGKTILQVQEIAVNWGATDPVEALVWAQQLPAADQPATVKAVMTGWVKSRKGNLDEARAMAGKLPEPLRASAIAAVALGWSEIDPPKAAAFALAEAPSSLAEVAMRWAKRDEAAATAWARGLTDPELRDKALIGLVGVVMGFNPGRAVTLADQVASPKSRNEAYRSIVLNGGTRNLDLLPKISDPRVRDGAIETLVQVTARTEPRLCTSLLDQMSDPASRDRAIDGILTWGSDKDPQNSVELLGRLARVNAIQYQKVAAGLARKDPVAAAVWALSLPEKQMDPQLGDPTKEVESQPRASAMNSVMNAWGLADPDGAERWIRQSSLTESQKASMLQVVQSRRRLRGK